MAQTTPISINDSARFLIQSTYGATPTAITEVRTRGYAGWIDNQFATASMDSHWSYVVERKGPVDCNPCDAQWINAVMESFWHQALQGPDQLRQRMVLALSEMFVVSVVNNDVLLTNPPAMAAYIDLLSTHAFGNYRDLLEAVATSPAMAHYLSHMRNQKEDPVSGRLPDENFAREVMQLFSIGLWQLNPDGTRRKTADGKDIPTYQQTDVMGLAKVFTGLSWAGPDVSEGRWQGWREKPWNRPLQFYPQYHSTAEKQFLGTVVPAGTSGPASLRAAIDTLFLHPNVGPFLADHLIKRFVTSNPSPTYVAAVAAAFNNNGQGVRGDLQAVLRAMLLHNEARSAALAAAENFGKVREPMIRYANFLRAFRAKALSGKFKIWNLEDTVASLGQNPLRAPSVFNWFRPDFIPPGELTRRGMAAPEMQVIHETTLTGYANFVLGIAERRSTWYRDNVFVKYGPVDDFIAADYSNEMGLANNPPALVDRLNALLVAGRLSTTTRQAIVDAVNRVPSGYNQGHTRVATAVALTMLSPEFMVQK